MRRLDFKRLMSRFNTSLALYVFLIMTLLAAGMTQAELTIVDPLTVLRDPVDVFVAAQLDEMRLVATRGGTASAQVVLEGVPNEVTVGDLEGPGGAVLPENALRVRYAMIESPYRREPGRLAPWLPDAGSLMPYYDVLQDDPNPEAELTPIWLTATLPPDQMPGRYTGTLTVDGHEVPVVLDVAGWTAPHPSDWVTYMNLVMSPETLARHYDVELWSEPHMQLVRQQLEFAASLGNSMVTIPLRSRNEYGRWPWIFFTETDDGYSVDFEILDRYLDLYEEVVGEPEFVLLFPNLNLLATRTGAGEPQDLRVPRPGEAGSENWLGALLDGLTERIETRGWNKGALMFQSLEGSHLPAEAIEMIAQLAPHVRWMPISHFRGERIRQRETALHVEDMKVGFTGHPFAGRGSEWGGWDIYPPRLTTYRVWMYHTNTLDQYRSFPSGSITRRGGRTSHHMSSMSGMTHIPLDFWQDEDGRSMLGRYSRLNWSTGFHRLNTFWLVGPGPDGPVGTARYEMLREGFIEAEARVKLEMALDGEWIDGEQAERAKELLEERAKVLWLDGRFGSGHGEQWQKGGDHDYGVADDWQDSALALFELAAEVAEAIGAPRYYERERPMFEIEFGN